MVEIIQQTERAEARTQLQWKLQHQPHHLDQINNASRFYVQQQTHTLWLWTLKHLLFETGAEGSCSRRKLHSAGFKELFWSSSMSTLNPPIYIPLMFACPFRFVCIQFCAPANHKSLCLTVKWFLAWQIVANDCPVRQWKIWYFFRSVNAPFA